MGTALLETPGGPNYYQRSGAGMSSFRLMSIVAQSRRGLSTQTLRKARISYELVRTPPAMWRRNNPPGEENGYGILHILTSSDPSGIMFFESHRRRTRSHE